LRQLCRLDSHCISRFTAAIKLGWPLKSVRSRHSESQVFANLFFAIINLEMSVQGKKRDWFDLGARAHSQACPGVYAEPTHGCPICRKPFTVEALDDGRLSKAHVPPQSVGSHELLLTCAACNNTAGTKLDAAAKTKEDVRLAMTGRPDRPHRIKATIGGITVNGQLHAKDGSYSLTIPKHLK
jgi:hypothetical protein